MRWSEKTFSGKVARLSDAMLLDGDSKSFEGQYDESGDYIIECIMYIEMRTGEHLGIRLKLA